MMCNRFVSPSKQAYKMLRITLQPKHNIIKKMKRLFLTVMLFVSALMASAADADTTRVGMPRLVVGVIVDQMRWDYLHYYSRLFASGGFRRLLDEGYSCDNCLISYVPTVTAAGHSCVYSGSIPAITGIAGNNFYIAGKKVYCTDDASVSTVGSSTDAGKMSPRNMRVTTMADALKMAQDFKSKTIGISLKDRGAILPAGHTADAAYWFDNDEGVFISSTYYMEEMPEWVSDFNSANRQTGDIRYTPTGNQLVADLAIAAIDGEGLGQGETTDFLAVSFSSTDYIGHRYGTRAPQTVEVYSQLDAQLASLLNALDNAVGKDNYLLFLTADHAAAHNADLMQSHGIPAGRWMETAELDNMNTYMQRAFSTSALLVKDYMEYRVYLDHDAIREAGLSEEVVTDSLLGYLRADDRVAYAVAFSRAAMETIPQPLLSRITRGYNAKRSGDIQVVLQPGYYGFGDDSYADGTTHGAWYPYDSHIPLLFMGWHVPHGSSPRHVDVTDICATICSLLGIQVPDGCIGEPIVF